jgi:glycosyltransferase involved in cell wall biosynthesis
MSVATLEPFPQRILVCHTYYQQAGGEDQVFADECALLESHGHEVFRYTMRNDVLTDMNKLAAAKLTIFNRESYDEISNLIEEKQIDLVHCHNTFPMISPSIYWAANEKGVPMVQTLHNFRLLCPGALLMRNGKPCEDCLGKTMPWPGVVHGCYRGSRTASAAVAAMLFNHNMRGTWMNRVQAFICLSKFSRNKFIDGGLPADRLFTAPNFMVGDPGPGEGCETYHKGTGGERFALFAGRISREKGLQTVIEAWRSVKGMPLKIVGDGPLAAELRKTAADIPNVQFLGRIPPEEVLPMMGKAACVIIPSVWYENCPKTLLESFAKGTPIIASRIGALEEMVDDGRTGLHFKPGDAADLARTMGRFAALTPQQIEIMRAEARQEYETKYTAEAHYPQLLSIYQQAQNNLRCARVSRELPVISHV